MKICLMAFVLISASYASTLIVPTEYPTIMSAINVALDGDTVLVLPGQYYETVDLMGKGILVKASGGPSSTLIYTPSGYVATYFASGEGRDSVLEGFRITNHWQVDNEVDGDERIANGGGCRIVDSSPTIRYNQIRDCYLTGSGDVGCGIYINGGSPLIENNEILYNVGNGSQPISWGGGIYCEDDTSEITGNMIIGNEALDGGGICCFNSRASIVGNVISTNASIYDGGGINLQTGFNGILSGNLISENTGLNGAGVYCRNSDCTITNNVISDNAGSSYSGIRIKGSVVLFANNTVACNMAEDSSYGAGGIGVVDDTLLIRNSIVWGNSAPLGPQISVIYDGSNPAMVEIEYSDIEGGLDSIFIDEECSVVWGSGNIDEDPLFQTGPLSDYHLSYGSPCIDAGNPASQYNDPEDPFNPGYALWPALGFLRNDMGAYGGGGIGYWLGIEDEPVLPEPGPTLNSYPNPFTGSANVVFQLLESSFVELGVYDLSGRLVEELYSGEAQWGPTVCVFAGSGLPSGVYIIHLRTEQGSMSLRSILIR